jgi:flagellar M-ring protein FliF
MVQLPGGEPQTLPISDEEITRVTNLVGGAVGYSPTRGDTIAVASSPFAEPTTTPEEPFWKDPQVIELGKHGAPYILLLIVLVFAYFAIIRPLMRVIAPSPEDKPAQAADGEEEEDDGVTVELSGAEPEEDSYESRLARARELARSNPKHVADLIKEWMGANDEGGRK